MRYEYSVWIARYLVENNPYGKCKVATEQMLVAFPELRTIKGHVYCAWGKRSHIWCVDQEGAIVDPTASQFPSLVCYEEWKPGMEVRAGKCMNCGDEIWERVQTLDEPPPQRCVCSPECEAELVKEYA